MAKQATTATEGINPQPGPVKADRNYTVTGLVPADRMPVQFDGREYDLASLTDEEAEYLLDFPEQVPYLKRGQ